MNDLRRKCCLIPFVVTQTFFNAAEFRDGLVFFHPVSKFGFSLPFRGGLGRGPRDEIKRHTLTLLTVFIALCPLLIGCAGKSQIDPGLMPELVPTHAPGTGGPTLKGNANAFVITPDQKDQTLSAKVGDTVEVRIPTIPMAGYTWQPQNLDTHILRQLGDPVYQPDTSPNAAGGTVILRFEVIGAGKTPLTLIYASSPGSGAPSFYSDSFGITIDAK